MTYYFSASIQQFSDGELHDDPKLKCYMHCVFHETGMIDDPPNEKRINIVRIHEVFEQTEEYQIILDMMRKCLYPEGDDMCEKSYKLNKCWKESDPKVEI